MWNMTHVSIAALPAQPALSLRGDGARRSNPVLPAAFAEKCVEKHRTRIAPPRCWILFLYLLVYRLKSMSSPHICMVRHGSGCYVERLGSPAHHVATWKSDTTLHVLEPRKLLRTSQACILLTAARQ